MSKNPLRTDDKQFSRVAEDHASEIAAREALLRLRELSLGLPEVDAVAIVRAGRESDALEK